MPTTVTAPDDYGQRVTVWRMSQHEREGRIKIDEFVLEPGASRDIPTDPAIAYETADLPVLRADVMRDANGEPRMATRAEALEKLTLDQVREASALNPGNQNPTAPQRELREKQAPVTPDSIRKRTDTEVNAGKSNLPETTLAKHSSAKTPQEPKKPLYSNMDPEAQARAERPIPEAQGIKAQREATSAEKENAKAEPAKPAPAAKQAVPAEQGSTVKSSPTAAPTSGTAAGKEAAPASPPKAPEPKK